MKKSTQDLRRAVKYDDIHLARAAIADGANVNAKLSNGNNLLFEVKSEPMAQLLIDLGTEMVIENRDGNTTLAIILMAGRPGVLELFLDCGASADSIINRDGKTLLTTAVVQGYSAEIELLLRKGANVNMKDGRGMTALLEAVRWGKADMVKMFIELGSDVNEADKDGNTPLHRSVTSFMGCPDIAEVLLEANADSDVKNNKSETALDLALEIGHHDIVRLIISHLEKLSERQNQYIFDLNI